MNHTGIIKNRSLVMLINKHFLKFLINLLSHLSSAVLKAHIKILHRDHSIILHNKLANLVDHLAYIALSFSFK